MASIKASRMIAAPVDLVFDTIADINNFSKVVPDIVNVEFLSEVRVGVGTKFRETRQMGKREAASILEVTEYERPEKVRLVSDMHGTVWDTVFTTSGTDGATELQMLMTATPHTLMARLFTPLAMGMVRKALDHDLDNIKTHCESESRSD